jgi:hypothetical protein
MTTLNDSFINSFIDQKDFKIDDNIFDEMAYQGFDPIFIRKQVMKKRWTQEELLNLIVFFLLRGTNIDKSTDRSTNECKKLITSLQAKGLTTDKTKRENITINRVISSFPDIVASVIAKHEDNCRILAKEFGGQLPNYLKFSSGASLCVDEEQLGKWVLWAKEQDKIINPKKPNPENVENYAKIQYASALFDIKKRKAIQNKLDSY